MRMTKFFLKLLFILALFPLLDVAVFAESWRGITPIHSTRDDVKRLLGKPSDSQDFTDFYTLDEGDVKIEYLPEPCGGISEFGDYNVAQNTVLEITIEPTEELPLTKFLKNLNITNLDKLKISRGMCTEHVYYTDKDRGLQFAVLDKAMYSYAFGAKASDSYLLCQEDAPDKK